MLKRVPIILFFYFISGFFSMINAQSSPTSMESAVRQFQTIAGFKLGLTRDEANRQLIKAVKEQSLKQTPDKGRFVYAITCYKPRFNIYTQARFYISNNRLCEVRLDYQSTSDLRKPDVFFNDLVNLLIEQYGKEFTKVGQQAVWTQSGRIITLTYLNNINGFSLIYSDPNNQSTDLRQLFYISEREIQCFDAISKDI